MKIIDVGQEAHGFIALGQVATGVFAFGQMATGVIAVGQVARGVIAVGQLSIGVYTIGMMSFGVFRAIGMMAVGATTRGFLALALYPFLRVTGRRPLKTLAALEEARRKAIAYDGWTEGVLHVDGNSFAVRVDDREVPILTPSSSLVELFRGLGDRPRVHAHLEMRGDADVLCTEIQPPPPPVPVGVPQLLAASARIVALGLVGVLAFFSVLAPLSRLF